MVQLQARLKRLVARCLSLAIVAWAVAWPHATARDLGTAHGPWHPPLPPSRSVLIGEWDLGAGSPLWQAGPFK